MAGSGICLAVGRNRSTAASIRPSESSLPSAASDSKIPGETVVAGDRHPDRLVEPARLDLEALGQRRQRRLDRRRRRTRRRRPAPRGRPRAGAGPRPSSPCARPSRPRPAARRGNAISGQTSSRVWAFSWTISQAAAQALVRLAPEVGARPRRCTRRGAARACSGRSPSAASSRRRSRPRCRRPSIRKRSTSSSVGIRVVSSSAPQPSSAR